MKRKKKKNIIKEEDLLTRNLFNICRGYRRAFAGPKRRRRYAPSIDSEGELIKAINKYFF
jgi:hypothetical protein